MFVAASSDRLLRIAYLLTGDAGHAEDVVQSALLRTARRWRSARQSPEAYARTTVVNLVKDRWRGLGRRPIEAPLEHDVVATRDAAAPTAPIRADAVVIVRSPFSSPGDVMAGALSRSTTKRRYPERTDEFRTAPLGCAAT